MAGTVILPLGIPPAAKRAPALSNSRRLPIVPISPPNSESVPPRPLFSLSSSIWFTFGCQSAIKQHIQFCRRRTECSVRLRLRRTHSRNALMIASKIRLWLAAVGIAPFAILATHVAPPVASVPQQAYSSSAQLEARRSSMELVPDGNLTKPRWKRAKWVEFDNDASGKPHYPEAATRVASVWTETHICFAFSSRYDSLNIYEGEDPKTERWQLCDRDVVEVFR